MNHDFLRAAVAIRQLIRRRARRFGQGDPLRPMLLQVLGNLERQAAASPDPAEEGRQKQQSQSSQSLRYNPPGPPGMRKT